MSDKEKIKQEIESYKESMEGLELYSDFRRGQITACNQIMQFIGSLPEETIVKGITWKDVNTLDTLINQVRYEFPNGIGEKSFGLAVLEKFQDYQDDIEELVSEDLDRLVISLEETIGTSPHSREVIKEHLQKAAEWQKQEMMKDAVNGTVCHRNGNVGDIYFQSDSVLSAKYPFKYGERIKIIIVKTKQQ